MVPRHPCLKTKIGCLPIQALRQLLITVSVILEDKCIVLLENCSGTFVDDSYNTTDA